MGPEEKPDIYKIVRMCMERNYDPLIVFSFSKKECEGLAKQVCTSMSLFHIVALHFSACYNFYASIWKCAELACGLSNQPCM